VAVTVVVAVGDGVTVGEGVTVVVHAPMIERMTKLMRTRDSI